MRAFRPSHYATGERDLDQELMEDVIRQTRVEVYCDRAAAGLPLFDSEELPPDRPQAKR